MLEVLIVVQIIIAVAMVGVILIQRNSSDGLSGLSGSSSSSFMSGRASANLLTRTTTILAFAFMANSLLMASVTSRTYNTPSSIADTIKIEDGMEKTTPQESPAPSAEPSVPRAE